MRQCATTREVSGVKAPLVSVIVLNHNSKEYLRACLDSCSSCGGGISVNVLGVRQLLGRNENSRQGEDSIGVESM